jgi:hypothetical protein
MPTKLSTLLDKFAEKKIALAIILFIVCVAITAQKMAQGQNFFWNGMHTHYNNYVIFKYSFLHLVNHQNLYLFYPHQYADLYKYSPSFALVMAAFYYLPDFAGLSIWNCINVFLLFYAIQNFKLITTTQKLILLLFLFFEIILTTQNSQSNALLAALTLLAFNSFENKKPAHATLLIAIGFYIKIYSVLGCLLLLLYPQKLKSILYLALWSVVFLLLPLVLITPQQLIEQYKNWYQLLIMDQSQSIGMSVFAFTSAISTSALLKYIMLLLGAIILIVPAFLFRRHINPHFRVLYLALILIWMVVFNHKAESPTFIIAMLGVGLWYFHSIKTKINFYLTLLTFFFTSLWFTDIVPRPLKEIIMHVQYIKPFFPILVLVRIAYSLLSRNEQYPTRAE